MKVGELILLFTAAAVAFSGGGGSGDADDGTPLAQTCDAIGLCTIPDTTNGTFRCPDGMTQTAAPVRSPVYQLATEDGSTSYAPGSIVPLILTVTRKQIIGKAERGTVNTSLESAKYIGLLMYAVREGDAAERKVGSWEVPVEVPSRFWVPPDAGCAERALMHSTAMPKSYVERFLFRAPAAGTGSLAIRALVKHGDTNAGAFYWLGTGPDPAAGVTGGDFRLTEAPPPPSAAPAWLRAATGETCNAACGRASRTCDESALAAARTASSLHSAIANDQMCRLPLLETCDNAPAISTLADGYCWYQPSNCSAAPAAGWCAAPAPAGASLSVGLCACSGGQRRLGAEEADADPTTGETLEAMGEDNGSVAVAAAAKAAKAAIGRCPNARRAASGAQPPCPTGARLLHGEAEEAAEAAEAEEAPTRVAHRTVALLLALVGSAAIGLSALSRRRGSGRHAALGALSLSPPALAHNWLNSPRSRTPKLSQTTPCPPRQRFHYPDIQVNRGQPFTVEWQVR